MAKPLRSPDPASIPLGERFALSLADAAAYLSVPERRLREAVARGELAIARHGGGAERDRFVLLRADVERWLLSLRRPAADEGAR